MSKVVKNLNQGEHIIAEAKRTPLLLIPKVIDAILWVVISIVGIVITQQAWLIAIALVAIILCVVTFIKFKRNTLTLTNTRVIFRVGVFNTRSVDMLYEQIESVEITQNLLGKLFHYSNICVSTGGIDFESLSGVVDGDKLRNLLLEQVDARKKAIAEEQAKMQAQAMRDALAAMQSSSNADK